MNDLDLRLEVVSRSCQSVRYIWRWISWKPSEIETWFQRTTNRKWHMGYRMVTLPMTSRDLDDVTWPWKVKLVTPIRLERDISKTTWARDFKFDTRLYMGNDERAHKKVPPKVGVAYVTWPYNHWHTMDRIFKTVRPSDFKFGKRLWLSGFAYYGLLRGSTIGYPSDSLVSCYKYRSHKTSYCKCQ